MTPLQETALRMCAHKTKYPLLSQAQKKAEQSSKSSGERIEPYKCDICGSWHIGHPKEYDLSAKPIEELYLAKIRDPFGNYWIFAVDSPEDLLKSTQEIYSEGTLVAYKKGKDPFKERGGSRSKHWRAFNAIYPIFITDSDYGFMEILESKKEEMGVIGVKPEDLPGALNEEDLGGSVETKEPTLEKLTYSNRKWLNPEGHPSTGSVVAYHGESAWDRDGKPDVMTILEISDCHNKVRLHRSEKDTLLQFINKMETLRDVVDEFVAHLRTVEATKI